MNEPLSESHPLSLELQSLRASSARFQDEAHASAVKLQRHSLDAVRAHERAVHLERENDVLKSELAVLRAHPPPGGHGQSSSTDKHSQIEELTLSLRRLSHKLSLTEEALLVANTSLVHSQVQSLKASANAESAYELGARVRGREEAALAKQRDLEWRIKKLEEELRMSDGVVHEYASLVRGMESRSSDTEALKLEDSLKEGKIGLERLYKELQDECDASERKVHAKDAELEVYQSQLEAERQTKENLATELAETRTELAKLKLEDGTAAKMVSRYMQFSQNATNNLLTTLKNLQARHSSTLVTISSQNHLLSTELRSLENQNERLRSTLDELGGEIMKEAYGRRREIAQRIRMGGREERIVEGLRRWIRRGDELLSRLRGDGDGDDDHHQETLSHPIDALLDLTQHARILVEGLEDGVLDEESAFSLSGARARETLVRLGVDGLLEELGRETERRITLEMAFAKTKNHEMEMQKREDEDDIPPKVPEKVYPTPDKNLLPLSTPVVPSEEKNHPSPLFAPVVDDLDTKAESTPHPAPSSPVPFLDVDIKDEEKIPAESLDPKHSSSSKADNLAEPTEVVEEPKIESGGLPKATHEEPDHEKALLSPDPEVDVSIPVEVVTEASNSVLPAIGDVEVTSQVVPNEEVDDSLENSPDPEVHDVQDTLILPVDSTPPSIPVTPSIVESISVQPHPMLAELVRINKRYDDLQRAFRDCHLALENLKAGLGTDTSSNTRSPSQFGHSSSSSTSSLISPNPISHIIPTDILRAALGRLDDFTEDARVELEIRVGDETLLAKGYEALLSVPGALTSAREEKTVLNGQGGHTEGENDIPVQSEVEQQIEAFVSGSDPAVRKARDAFAKKLEDVQHDIAALKRAIHDPESLEVFDISSDASASASALASTSSLSLPHSEQTNGNGNGWTSWIRGSPSRPNTPSPANPSLALGPSPTFGSIMTSPRLRHSPSNSSFHSQGSRSRKGSFFGFGLGGAPEQSKDPLSVLGLRVPMPNFGGTTSNGTGSAHPGVFGASGGYGLMSPTSPMGSAPRPRTVSSSMYMLGIGANSGSSGPVMPMQMSRSASGGYAGHHKTSLNNGSHRPGPTPPAKQNGTGAVDEEGADTTDDDDTDVE